MKVSDVTMIDGKLFPFEREETNEEKTAREQAEYEAEHQPATDFDRVEAQTMYTALMTDTLIEGE